MSHVQKQQAIHGIALGLAPSLRDKFDFSMDTQHGDWAKLSLKAATAFAAEMQVLLDVAAKRDADDRAKAQAEYVAAQAAQKPAQPLTTVGGEPKTEGAEIIE